MNRGRTEERRHSMRIARENWQRTGRENSSEQSSNRREAPEEAKHIPLTPDSNINAADALICVFKPFTEPPQPDEC